MLLRWEYFISWTEWYKHCHLLNLHWVNDVWQNEMFTATDYQRTTEPSVPEFSSSKAEIDTE